MPLLHSAVAGRRGLKHLPHIHNQEQSCFHRLSLLLVLIQHPYPQQ